MKEWKKASESLSNIGYLPLANGQMRPTSSSTDPLICLTPTTVSGMKLDNMVSEASDRGWHRDEGEFAVVTATTTTTSCITNSNKVSNTVLSVHANCNLDFSPGFASKHYSLDEVCHFCKNQSEWTRLCLSIWQKL